MASKFNPAYVVLKELKIAAVRRNCKAHQELSAIQTLHNQPTEKKNDLSLYISASFLALL